MRSRPRPFQFGLILALLALASTPRDAAAQHTTLEDVVFTRISVDSQGNQGDNGSGFQTAQTISGDGRFVVFISGASNLVPGDTNQADDAFVHDRLTGETRRVSVSSTGAQAHGGTEIVCISADGRFIAFGSYAANLVGGDTNTASDVFVHDCITGETTRVSVDSSGQQANDGSSRPSISADGRYVAFNSVATNLVPGDTNGRQDVFLHDRLTRTTTRVSVDSSGIQGDGDSGDGASPSLSSDGRFVAFMSFADNLVPGDINHADDIFVHDLVTGTTEIASVGPTGYEGNSGSLYPSISSDGRYVAFESGSTNFVAGDTNKMTDVFVHDRLTGATDRASVTSSGVQGDGNSIHPSLSADGRFVVFESSARNLVPLQDGLYSGGIVLRDLRSRQTWCVSTPRLASLENASDHPSISGDGRYVAFGSWSGGYVRGDTNEVDDVFVRGPELTLEADPEAPGAGQRLTLTTYTGPVGEPASLWAVSLDGTPVLAPVASGSFRADGTFVVSGMVPSGLSGHTVGFRGYARNSSRLVVHTNDEPVSFR
jgi:Tol biopolymer transport system component